MSSEKKNEGKIEAAVNIIVKTKASVSEAVRILELPETEQKKIIEELNKRNISYVLE